MSLCVPLPEVLLIGTPFGSLGKLFIALFLSPGLTLFTTKLPHKGRNGGEEDKV